MIKSGEQIYFPISVIISKTNIFIKGRPIPIGNRFEQTIFHRIKMDIIGDAAVSEESDIIEKKL